MTAVASEEEACLLGGRTHIVGQLELNFLLHAEEDGSRRENGKIEILEGRELASKKERRELIAFLLSTTMDPNTTSTSEPASKITLMSSQSILLASLFVALISIASTSLRLSSSTPNAYITNIKSLYSFQEEKANPNGTFCFLLDLQILVKQLYSLQYVLFSL